MVEEISWDDVSADTGAALRSGRVVLLRGCPLLPEFRENLLSAVAESGGAERAMEVRRFYGEGIVPRAETLLCLSGVIRKFRASLRLSRCLSPLVRKLSCEPQVLLDGGISRLAIPRVRLDEIRRCAGFADDDFERTSADGEVEIFMPGPANIHRDFNRIHYLFQFNIWFPLHPVDEKGVLRIWPDFYRVPVDLPSVNAGGADTLGKPLDYRLDLGDCVIFHGEHLHASPVAQREEDGYRRHSYDFRVAANAYDDNTHYRKNFWNLENFPPLGEVAPGQSAPDAQIARLASGDAGGDELSGIFRLFQTYRYCDDRYILLLRRVLESAQDELVLEILAFIREHSVLPAFLVEASRLTFGRVSEDQTSALLFAALHHATRLGSYRSFEPLKYQEPANQSTPADFRRYCLDKLSTFGCGAGGQWPL